MVALPLTVATLTAAHMEVTVGGGLQRMQVDSEADRAAASVEADPTAVVAGTSLLVVDTSVEVAAVTSAEAEDTQAAVGTAGTGNST